MILYLHSIYNGGNKYFSIDIWVEEKQCFYPIPNYDNLDKNTRIADIYKIVEELGARKLILDF